MPSYKLLQESGGQMAAAFPFVFIVIWKMKQILIMREERFFSVSACGVYEKSCLPDRTLTIPSGSGIKSLSGGFPFLPIFVFPSTVTVAMT
jgi:hypothetical protein